MTLARDNVVLGLMSWYSLICKVPPTLGDENSVREKYVTKQGRAGLIFPPPLLLDIFSDKCVEEKEQGPQPQVSRPP